MQLSDYRSMMMIVMFDLPTDNKTARKRYAKFRTFLLEDGFTMLQYSVYGRHAPTQEIADVHMKRVEKKVPPEGEVRILLMTDKQYSKTKMFIGKIRKKVKNAPQQLEFF